MSTALKSNLNLNTENKVPLMSHEIELNWLKFRHHCVFSNKSASTEGFEQYA
jgi:hypothetical protein